jgi:broad specificity phosphatase PhoE
MNIIKNSKNVYLVRHGETDWNKRGLIQGHSDIPLNQKGIEQATLLAKKLQESSINYICSSDLQRARHTAEIIAKNKQLTVNTFTQLRERHFGQLEGKEYTLIRSKLKEGSAFGVESLQSMKKRGMSFLQSIINEVEGESLLIVSHGGLINSIIHEISKGTLGTGITKLSNTSITHLEFNGEWIVHLVNDDQHLLDLEKE